MTVGYLTDTGARTVAFIVLVVGSLALFFLTIWVRRGRRLHVRPLPAFDQLAVELGEAAEKGASLHVSLGSGGIGRHQTLTSLAGLEVLAGIADTAVAYGITPLVTVGDATILPLAQDILRRAHIRAGVPERYRPSAVRFVAPTPFAYALGARDILIHERVTGNVLAGLFAEEAVLLTQEAEERDLFQTAAVDRLRAVSAVYPASTFLAIGEELYAAGALLTGRPRYLASLTLQDGLRFLLVVVILLSILIG